MARVGEGSANESIHHYGERAASTTGWSPSATASGLVLLLLVAAAPWAFGAVSAGVQVLLFGVVLFALAGCWCDQVLSPSSPKALSVAILPLFLASLLGAVQLIPMPTEVGEKLSPTAVALWQALDESQPSELSESGGSAPENAGPDSRPLTLYPASTRRDLCLLLLGSAVFLLGGCLFRSSKALLILWWACAVNGAALAVFGIVQQVSGNGLIYGKIASAGRPFASFVNRNNAAGFLNLCLACAVGLLVWALLRKRALAHDPEQPFRSDGLRDESLGRLPALLAPIGRFLASLDALKLASLAIIACLVAGIFCSLSRGGFLAMVAAGAVTCIVALTTTRRKSWAMLLAVVATVAGLGLVGWTGRSEVVRSRLQTLLGDQQHVSQGRLAHWQDGAAAAEHYWRTGSGLGTYRHVYRLHQQQPSDAWFYHAENQYLEALVDGGVIGLALMLVMIGLVGLSCWRLLRQRDDFTSYALGLAGVFALAGQVFHGLVDFGLYIPSNMLLFALLCGAVTGRAALLCQAASSARRRRPVDSTANASTSREINFFPWLSLPRSRLVGPSVAALLFCAVLFGYVEARGVAEVESALAETEFHDDPTDQSVDQIRAAISRVSSAVERRQHDALARQRLASLWVQLHRVQTFKRLRETAGDQRSDARLWQFTSPTRLHAEFHRLDREKREIQIEQLRSDPTVRTCLFEAIRQLRRARRECPLLAKVHLLLAELCGTVQAPADDQIHIRRAQLVAPTDEQVLLASGQLDLQAGRNKEACAAWKRCIELSPANVAQVLKLARGRLDIAQYAGDLFPASPVLLIEIAETHFQADSDAKTVQSLLRRAELLVTHGHLRTDERHYLLGTINTARHEYAEAVVQLEKAIALRPNQASWRFETAKLLRRLGKMDEAHLHAKLAVRLQPNNEQYESLLREIIRAQLTTGSVQNTTKS